MIGWISFLPILLTNISLLQIVDFPILAYSEVQSRFDSQKFFPLSSSYVLKADSIASVTVEIPDDFRLSDGWGVAVFVALEEIDEGFLARHMRLFWNFDTLEPEEGPSLSPVSGSSANNDM